jgi:hypothetical protein
MATIRFISSFNEKLINEMDPMLYSNQLNPSCSMYWIIVFILFGALIYNKFSISVAISSNL